MKQLDREAMERIWQRVQGDPSAEMPSVLPLLYRAIQLEEGYARLQRLFPGEAAPQQLLRQQKNHIRILRGLCLLREESPPELTGSRAEPGTGQSLLRRCIGLTLQAQRDYLRLGQEPEFGAVFDYLQRQSVQQCKELLALYGG